MLAELKNRLRRRLRATQRAAHFPLRLPHHTLTSTGTQSIDGSERRLDPPLLNAIKLCDGTQTLSQVARASNTSRHELIRAQDEGLILLWRSPVPKVPPASAQHPHAIIVSPHPDDAALSCGGRMLGDASLLVLNVFTKTAWWRFKDGDIATIQACRRAEEDLVSRLSGAAMTALDIPEALLRGHRMQDVFTAAPGERDAQVSTKIRNAVAATAHQHSLAHWFLPLGVGNHIDHRIVRDAARDALSHANVKPSHLHFYEDLPYAAKLGPRPDFSQHLAGLTLQQEILELDDLIGWKLELLRAYWSQFRWPELAELKAYARAIGGEAIWNPRNYDR
jgi:LmbE family N-acetylglucosaminyl deacetylase